MVVFAFNRPWHLQQTLEALKANELAAESELFIFCDGPKPGSTTEQLDRIAEVRKIADAQTWPKKLTVVKSEINKGLGDSVISGVTKIISEHGRIIVVEDDVVTSKYFLRFMNDALRVYENDERVLSIGSWNYFTGKNVRENFFMQMPDTIAWASWARAWKFFEADAAKLVKQLEERKLIKKFNLGNRFNFVNMLVAQAQGNVSSWAIRWTAVAVLHDTLTFYPSTAISKHIGFGADSTNCEGEDYNKNLVLAHAPLEVKRVPLVESDEAVEDWMHIERDVKRSGSVMDNSVKGKLKSIARRAKNKLIPPKPTHGWFGNYATWEEAKKQASGYDNELILEKVKNALLKVKRGEAAYERDSVAFDKLETDAVVAKWLNQIAAEANHPLSVIDFGGSLGSTYFQYRQVMPAGSIKSWTVVEQPHFVETGAAFFADGTLDFSLTIKEAMLKGKPDVLLLFSVLPYLEEPWKLLEEISKMEIPYVIVDRTAILEWAPTRLTLQVVPEQVYKASYPSWFFNRRQFVESFQAGYVLQEEFPSKFAAPYRLDDGTKASWKGFVFKRK